MNTQAVEEKQIQEFIDHQRIVSTEYGGLPRAGAQATAISEKEVTRVQSREIDPPAQTDEPPDPPGEIYSLGSRGGRIVGASIALAIVIAPGFIFQNAAAILLMRRPLASPSWPRPGICWRGGAARPPAWQWIA